MKDALTGLGIGALVLVVVLVLCLLPGVVIGGCIFFVDLAGSFFPKTPSAESAPMSWPAAVALVGVAVALCWSSPWRKKTEDEKDEDA